MVRLILLSIVLMHSSIWTNQIHELTFSKHNCPTLINSICQKFTPDQICCYGKKSVLMILLPIVDAQTGQSAICFLSNKTNRTSQINYGKTLSNLTSLFSANNSFSKHSDTALFVTYISQNIGLLSYLIPLFFFDPHTGKDKDPYLVSSTALSTILLPAGFLAGLSLVHLNSIESGQGPSLFLGGLLGTTSGFLIPVLMQNGRFSSKQLFTSKSLTGALCGFVTGTLIASAFHSHMRTSYSRSVLIFSSTCAGMITGGVLSQTSKSDTEKNTIRGILLGGWSGFFAGYILQKRLSFHPYFDSNIFSMEFSLPAVTNIPLIAASNHFPKLEHVSVKLVQFNLRF